MSAWESEYQKNIDEIQSSYLFIALKYGTLYVFMLMWHLVSVVVFKTARDIALGVWKTPKTKAEERQHRQFLERNSVLKLSIFSLMVFGINIFFVLTHLTNVIFFQTALVFYSLYFLVSYFRIDIWRFIFGSSNPYE